MKTRLSETVSLLPHHRSSLLDITAVWRHADLSSVFERRHGALWSAQTSAEETLSHGQLAAGRQGTKTKQKQNMQADKQRSGSVAVNASTEARGPALVGAAARHPRAALAPGARLPWLNLAMCVFVCGVVLSSFFCLRNLRKSVSLWPLAKSWRSRAAGWAEVTHCIGDIDP